MEGKIRSFIITVFIIVLIIVTSYNKGRRDGFNRGAELGVNVTLDSVRQILIKQIKSDTSVSKMVLILPDTDTYYLSRKTLIPDDYR